jgi:hypothetical protein
VCGLRGDGALLRRAGIHGANRRRDLSGVELRLRQWIGATGRRRGPRRRLTPAPQRPRRCSARHSGSLRTSPSPVSPNEVLQVSPQHPETQADCATEGRCPAFCGLVPASSTVGRLSMAPSSRPPWTFTAREPGGTNAEHGMCDGWGARLTACVVRRRCVRSVTDEPSLTVVVLGSRFG